MLRRLFSKIGKKGPESATISGQLVVPATYEFSTHVHPVDSEDSGIINPEDSPIPPGTKPTLYEVGLRSKHQVNIHGSIISPEEPIHIKPVVTRQLPTRRKN